ncbi:hypothetical protein SAM40697_5266 [Streptomyces ambofaciens]|uniref:Secreted protein n=1 Tax=Streptomyces ambofaciens TaxID=1889 RepID=A0ABM6B5Y1_STRAM|nr:hypothetical protein [Streptomyces ambofaciens]ANB09222.1 hypothetical protein SAM40697_5266 [Streptomyces ambofaciens]
MLRGTTARTVLSLLAAVLLALQFLTPGTSFASAHTDREAVANARSGDTPSAAALHDETATCHTAGRSGKPAPAPRVRDRHRTAAAPQPDAPLWPLPRQGTSVAPAPAPSGGTAEDRPRHATDLSPAVLQVFRC